ncbi:MAG: efflux RND transporter periplasmic adaptor subunit [Chloroflexota bacterium]
MTKRKWILLASGVAALAVALLVVRAWAQGGNRDTQDLQTATVSHGTVAEVVDAGGTIEVPLVSTLVWCTSGRVGTVCVEIGDRVKAGDVLMELDPETLEASVVQAQAELLAAQEELEQLLAGATEQEVAAAQLRLAEAQEALHDAQYNRTVLQQGNRASSDTIAGARASVVLAQDVVDRAQAEYDQYSGRPSDDPARAAALLRLVAARQSLLSAQRTLDWYLGKPTEIQQAVLDAQVASAEAEVEAAQQALEDLQDGPDPVDVAAARARVASAQDLADQARLVAPFDGTVVGIYTASGDLVSSGTSGVVVADLSRYEVQVSVSEVDVERIAVGQEATLSLDALPDQDFVGRVEDVSFLGVSNQGVVTYSVTIVLDDPDPALRPGMTAAASIVVERHEDVLVVPNRAIQTSAGQKVVHVLFEGRVIEVPVTLGLIGDTTSEVLEGALKESDVVVLNTSSTSQSTTFGPGPGIFGVGGFGP